jgi:hypothetical protein
MGLRLDRVHPVVALWQCRKSPVRLQIGEQPAPLRIRRRVAERIHEDSRHDLGGLLLGLAPQPDDALSAGQQIDDAALFAYRQEGIWSFSINPDWTL